MEADGAPRAPLTLTKDGKFLGGLAGGTVILLAAAFLEGDLRLVGLLDIAPFGLAAVQALRDADPAEIVIAVPAAPESTWREFAGLVDDVVCATMPTPFPGCGAP